MAKFNKARVKAGDWVRIRFWDHRKNDDDIREYYVCGRVHRVSVRAITVDTWSLIDPESADRDPGETCETISILKKAIVELIIVVDNTDLIIAKGEVADLKDELKSWDGHDCEPRDAIDLD
jgi:hypothetical protein